MAAVAMPVEARGKYISVKICHSLQPSIEADSPKEVGRVLKKPVSRKMANGKPLAA